LDEIPAWIMDRVEVPAPEAWTSRIPRTGYVKVETREAEAAVAAVSGVLSHVVAVPQPPEAKGSSSVYWMPEVAAPEIFNPRAMLTGSW